MVMIVVVSTTTTATITATTTTTREGVVVMARGSPRHQSPRSPSRNERRMFILYLSLLLCYQYSYFMKYKIFNQHIIRNATQRNATQRNATQHNAAQRSTTQHNAAQCSTQHYSIHNLFISIQQTHHFSTYTIYITSIPPQYYAAPRSPSCSTAAPYATQHKTDDQ